MADKTTEVKVRIRGFTYYKETPDPQDSSNTITVAQFASRGQIIEVNDADLERGEDIDAFVDPDADVNAAAPADLAEVNVEDLSDDELDDLLESQSPNVDQTVALAGDDPENASRLLAAEERVTGESPRQGVEDGLNKIIGD